MSRLRVAIRYLATEEARRHMSTPGRPAPFFLHSSLPSSQSPPSAGTTSGKSCRKINGPAACRRYPGAFLDRRPPCLYAAPRHELRVPTSVPVLVLLLAAVAAIRCAASPAWPPPEEVTLSDEGLFSTPLCRPLPQPLSYCNAALVDETTLTGSLFQWRYGLLGGEGLLVLSLEPATKPTPWKPARGGGVANDRLLYRSTTASWRAIEKDQIPPPASGFLLRPEAANQLNPWKPVTGTRT